MINLEKVSTLTMPDGSQRTIAIRIHDLRIDRQAIAAYLNAIAPEKQEIALIHALEVGVTEMIARRARFRPS